LKRIAITGPESTGKSWLAKKLAAHFKTFYVPEYAREYLSKLDRVYTIDDIVEIARGQLHIEALMATLAGDILIADTEMLVCKIWTEFVFGSTPEPIDLAFQKQEYDIYLLCNIDLPWEPDPLREHPNRRAELFDRYEHYLKEYNLSYGIVNGTGDERLVNAMHILKRHF
jgi:NadR type nicotinamide-nucleotide adenylyltransferase